MWYTSPADSYEGARPGRLLAVAGSFKIDCSGHLGEDAVLPPGILLATATDSLAPGAHAVLSQKRKTCTASLPPVVP